MDIVKAYASLNMPPSRYITRYALPLLGAGVAFVGVFYLLLPGLFVGFTAYIFYSIPVFFFLLAVIYPYTVAEAKKHQINNNIHFFITHMGVLATSNIPRSDIMRVLGEKKEYGALAEETSKIHSLTDKWNMSLPEACRFVSKRCPSDIYSDFLDRFAYSLESGEELEQFLVNEQKVIMEEFGTHYKGALYGLEAMKEMLSSLLMSGAFIIIFAMLVPVITGMSSDLLMGGALFIVVTLEAMLLYLTKARAPTDTIWYLPKYETPVSAKLKRALPICLLSSAAIGVALMWFFPSWPYAIKVAMALSPLAYVGATIHFEEEKIKRRDDSFPAFVRSLGASAAARGGQLTEVLRHLKNHDFGPLTENIQNLYTRLNLRVDDQRAWDYFAAETGSNLIEKFSRMFIEGVQSGGKADTIGRIISDNMTQILALRKARYQSASGFRGLLYGLSGGLAFALFAALGIIAMLKRLFDGMDLSDAAVLGGLFHFEFDLTLIAFFILLMLLTHALAGSLIIKIADGGNYFRAYLDFPAMFWVSAIVSVAAQAAVDKLL